MSPDSQLLEDVIFRSGNHEVQSKLFYHYVIEILHSQLAGISESLVC